MLFILAGNEAIHKISDEFEFQSNRNTDYGVSCLWGIKNSHRLTMGRRFLHASSFTFYPVIIKVAGNQDKHKSSDEFDFGPLVSMVHFVWNEIWPWHTGLRRATLPFELLVLKISSGNLLIIAYHLSKFQAPNSDILLTSLKSPNIQRAITPEK